MNTIEARYQLQKSNKEIVKMLVKFIRLLDTSEFKRVQKTALLCTTRVPVALHKHCQSSF